MVTARPIPLELLRLQNSTRAYLAILRDTMPAVVRLGGPGSFLLSLMDAAAKQNEWGTPGSIAMATAELIGESTQMRDSK